MSRNPFAPPPTFGQIHQAHPKQGPSKRALPVTGMTLPPRNEYVLATALSFSDFSVHGELAITVPLVTPPVLERTQSCSEVCHCIKAALRGEGDSPSLAARPSEAQRGPSQVRNDSLSSWLHVQFFLPSQSSSGQLLCKSSDKECVKFEVQSCSSAEIS